ncbi:MAG TPA: hypothetical protein VFT84_13365, partial [Gemmatimonadales bacterium]|nr:hypothetical protein [Gemmatimonadales bacterium]
QLAALLHHAYLFWEAGCPVVVIDEAALVELLAPPASSPDPAEGPRAFYAEFPERRIWATVMEGEPPEPLEGCFVHSPAPEALRTLGVFGLRPDRLGFSVVEAGGGRPGALARLDGTPLFAPAMAGGAAARLHSLVGAEELLELGWRSWQLAGAGPTGAGRWTR